MPYAIPSTRRWNAPPCSPLWGTTLYTLEEATNCVLAQLYRGFLLPHIPISRRKRERNEEIRNRYAAGENVPELARLYSISEQRIHQILRGKRT
ncbi:Mor transcription activator family protein [Aggregatilinea lenta]|uniref:Mor transcription activator family protein n=1 Tax=Aggregatilinea lenta TaxID=913108 RepID=UPI000E5A7229